MPLVFEGGGWWVRVGDGGCSICEVRSKEQKPRVLSLKRWSSSMCVSDEKQRERERKSRKGCKNAVVEEGKKGENK